MLRPVLNTLPPDEDDENGKESFKLMLTCDPPPTKEEFARWREEFSCKCMSLKSADCTCVCAIDRAKEPRLMAMLEGNAAHFGLPVPFFDESIPLLCIRRCIVACGLIHVWETQTQKYIAYNARKSEFETNRREPI